VGPVPETGKGGSPRDMSKTFGSNEVATRETDDVATLVDRSVECKDEEADPELLRADIVQISHFS
jgi:hypothetical protein